MNPFNTHPQKQGVTYTAHLLFAMGIAIRLLQCVIAFASHAIFPFIDIRRSLDLEATTDYLQEQNEWIESMKPSRQPPIDDGKQWENMSLSEQTKKARITYVRIADSHYRWHSP